MRSVSWVFVGVFLVGSLGCRSSEAEAARMRAEAELARQVAENDASKTRLEIEAARTENAILRMQLEQLRAELKSRNIPVPEPVKPAEPASGKTLEQRAFDLQNLYNKNAISLQEWTDMKRKMISDIPNQYPATDTRTLGKRLMDLRPTYDKSAFHLQEWTDAKSKLINQTPAVTAKLLPLESELLDLKTAYDQNAINLQEWTDAKAVIAKRAK